MELILDLGHERLTDYPNTIAGCISARYDYYLTEPYPDALHQSARIVHLLRVVTQTEVTDTSPLREIEILVSTIEEHGITMETFFDRTLRELDRLARQEYRTDLGILILELGYDIYGQQFIDRYREPITNAAEPNPPTVIRPSRGTEALARARSHFVLTGSELPMNATIHCMLKRPWIDVYARVVTSRVKASADTVVGQHRTTDGQNVGITVFVDGITKWYEIHGQTQYATDSPMVSAMIAETIGQGLNSHIDLSDAAVMSTVGEAHQRIAAIRRENGQLLGAATVHIALVFQQPDRSAILKFFTVAEKHDAAPLIVYSPTGIPTIYRAGESNLRHIGDPLFELSQLRTVDPLIVRLLPGQEFCMYSDAVMLQGASGPTISQGIVALNKQPNLLSPDIDNFDDFSGARIKIL